MVEVKFSQNEVFTIQLKKEYKCSFVGSADVSIVASLEHGDDFYVDRKTFSVTFTYVDNCLLKPQIETEYLSFEGAELFLRDSERKYPLEFVYELERYIYVKNGETRFYPT